MKICRLCLCKTKNEVPITSGLVVRIKECVSIVISFNENYSNVLCSKCLKKIKDWHEFKAMCWQSKATLEAKQGNNVEVKQENISTVLISNQNSRDINSKPEQNIDLNDPLYIEQSGEFDVFNQQDNLNIPFEQLDDSENIDDIDRINLFSEPPIDSKQSVVKEDNTLTIESELYTCEVCSKTFAYYTDYLDHQNDHNGEAVFNCANCEMTFSSKRGLVLHESSHKLPCHICGKDIKKRSMKLHLNKHTDKFKCTHCSLTFTCTSLLREHINARHMKLKPYFCDVCGKDFATKSSLILHLKIHREDREYKCKKCDYAGRTSISLRIHMSKHENNTCICEYCSKIFKSNRNLNDHLKRVHTMEKKHCCDFCEMKFALRYLLEQHRRTHTGIHPYKCSKCSKTFARSDGLKEHMKTHDRTEIFICPVCNKHFLTSRGVKRHICGIPLKTTKSSVHGKQ